MIKRVQPYLWLLALAGVPFLPLLFVNGESLLIWPGADISDLVTAHLPASEFIHFSISHWGQLPLWNPSLLSGMPTLGDPLNGLAYPPLWLTYLLPTSGSYHLLIWLHLWWAGVGIYHLAREAELHPTAAWLAGAIVALSPRLFGQWGLGHATLLFAFSWTPWALYSLQRGFADFARGASIPLKWFGVAGGLVGLAAVADPRWALPVGSMAALFILFQILQAKLWPRWPSLLPALISALLTLAGSVAFLALPMLDLLAHSTRANIEMVEVQNQAMPLAALLGMVVPDPATWPEWSAAIGSTVFILAAVGLLAGRRGFLWVISFGLAVVLSLGPVTPLWILLSNWLPGFEVLRMPGRWFLLAILAAAMLAAHGLHLLHKKPDGNERRAINLVTVAASSLVMMLGVAKIIALGLPFSASEVGAGLAIFSAGILLFFIIKARVKLRYLAAVVVVELLVVSYATLQVHPIENRVPDGLKAFLPAEYGQARLFSTTFLLDQTQAARQQFELANGVHPLQLNSYWEYMAATLNFSSDEYSVVLPPFTDQGAIDPSLTKEQLDRLAAVNIGYLLTEIPLEQDGLLEETKVAGLNLYRLQPARPRVWVQTPQENEGSDWSEAEIVRWTPNRIEVEATGPGRLVLSEINYPIWRAWVDGEPTPIVDQYDLLRAVNLLEGSHTVVFRAGLGKAWLGLAVSVLSWLAIGFLWLKT